MVSGQWEGLGFRLGFRLGLGLGLTLVRLPTTPERKPRQNSATIIADDLMGESGQKRHGSLGTRRAWLGSGLGLGLGIGFVNPNPKQEQGRPQS
jgi:hypothetical protein